MRHWSVCHSRQLKKIYEVIERLLTRLYPVISKFGYERAEIPVFAVEKPSKDCYWIVKIADSALWVPQACLVRATVLNCYEMGHVVVCGLMECVKFCQR